MAGISSLSNDALLDETKRLAANERRSTAALIEALREIDGRRLYLAEGYSCMFLYCRDELHLSESAAYSRIEVARVSRAFPQIIDALKRAALNLTTAMLIAPHLTPEDADALIEAATFKTRREVERLIAERYPKPDVPAVVRKQPEPRMALLTSAVEDAAPAAPELPATCARSIAPPPKPAVVAPLSAARYKVQFTADQDTHDKLRQAQALLRYQVPNGDLATIVNKALTLLIADVERRRLGLVARPREKGRALTADSRHIPARVRREVWNRDKGRCAFLGASGRCREVAPLEFHHVVPFAAGGAAAADNIQLRCRAHNVHEGVLYFGEEVMAAARGAAE